MFIGSLLTTQARTCLAVVKLFLSTASTPSKVPLSSFDLTYVSFWFDSSYHSHADFDADVSRVLALTNANELSSFFKGCLNSAE